MTVGLIGSLLYHNFMIEFTHNLFEYLDHRGVGVVEDWKRGKDKDIIARVDRKLDLLNQHGSDLPPGLLAGTKSRHIDKLRIFGKGVTVRVLICRGPINPRDEFTVLFIAQEKDRKLIPKDAESRAEQRRQEILINAERRRRYERANQGS